VKRSYLQGREPYGFLDAYLRYEWAREHLADFKRLIEEFRATPHEVDPYIDTELLRELLESGDNHIHPLPIPYDIPIRIGEIAYNLRCALDYLVFALSWHDTGIEPTEEWAGRLQFPIESDIKVFEGRRSKILEGVGDPHVAMIREYQPAEGCHWTAYLAELNNSDKHRHLMFLAGMYDPEGKVTRWFSVTPEMEAKEALGVLYPLGSVDMKSKTTYDVVFPNGDLVAEVMQELESEVRALLLRFAREFVLSPL
jgi:hypothetical protein